jgi:SHS family lactate transporter-like MFS transporter
VPLTAVAFVFTVTLWMRLIGATASGWMADRMGRKAPLMISILWFSACNFIAGFSPTFAFLFFFRALLGIGMGAEWPAGAALAMETWPARSRGLMSGFLQGSWGIGFALSALCYGYLYGKPNPLHGWWPMAGVTVGWREMLWIGILPALVCIWIRFFVKEPPVWEENQRLQAEQGKAVKMPLFAIFQRKFLWNTLTGMLWMAASMCTYYSIWALFSTYLQKEHGFTPEMVRTPVFWANIIGVAGSAAWGVFADKYGRRWAMILPAACAIAIAPIYLTTRDPAWIVGGFLLQALFGGSMYGQMPSYLSERFPTEVRATASGFVFHQATIFGGLVAPMLTYLAVDRGMGFATPMMFGTMGFATIVIIALLLGPETKGKVLTPEIEVKV